MATRVNYDDNLFFAMAIIRALRAGLQLDIDPDFFRDKVIEDVFFVDRTLDQMYEALRTNTFLINRRDHLRELMRAKRSFADMLGETLEGGFPFSAHIENLYPKLGDVRDKHVCDITDIQNAMETSTTEEDQQTIVSQDEYRFLFQNDNEEP